jgi:hypothetical protein
MIGREGHPLIHSPNPPLIQPSILSTRVRVSSFGGGPLLPQLGVMPGNGDAVDTAVEPL